MRVPAIISILHNLIYRAYTLLSLWLETAGKLEKPYHGGGGFSTGINTRFGPVEGKVLLGFYAGGGRCWKNYEESSS